MWEIPDEALIHSDVIAHLFNEYNVPTFFCHDEVIAWKYTLHYRPFFFFFFFGGGATGDWGGQQSVDQTTEEMVTWGPMKMM